MHASIDTTHIMHVCILVLTLVGMHSCMDTQCALISTVSTYRCDVCCGGQGAANICIIYVHVSIYFEMQLR